MDNLIKLQTLIYMPKEKVCHLDEQNKEQMIFDLQDYFKEIIRCQIEKMQ